MLARILVAADAWHPQVNGVVHTMDRVASELRAAGDMLEVIGPDRFLNRPAPSCPDIRLAAFPHGRPLKWPRRVMAEAIVSLVRSGPVRLRRAQAAAAFSALAIVHSQLTRWRRDGTLKRLHDALREHAREKEGRNREPSAAVIDPQTARAAGAGGPDRGYDAGQKN